MLTWARPWKPHRTFQDRTDRAGRPRLIIYTSGTTGPPKGALHAHRVLLGHLPGVELPHDFFPQPGDLFWTPADWAWIGGLIDVLLPAFITACRCLPTASASSIRRRPLPDGPARRAQRLPAADRAEADAAGGGAPGDRLPAAHARERRRDLGRGAARLGSRDLRRDDQRVLRPDRVQPRGRQLRRVLPVRPGSMGRPIPGHVVEIVSDDGTVCRPARPAYRRSGARIR